MNISNFKLVEIAGTCVLNYVAVATVEIEETEETGMFWWKKRKITIETVEVTRAYGAPQWTFTKTGKFTPKALVEEMERALSSKERKDIFKITWKDIARHSNAR